MSKRKYLLPEEAEEHRNLSDDDVLTLFFTFPHVFEVVEYLEGFVPNSYKFPRPFLKVIHRKRNKDDIIPLDIKKLYCYYDGKRSYGHGPRWTVKTFNHGILATNNFKNPFE